MADAGADYNNQLLAYDVSVADVVVGFDKNGDIVLLNSNNEVLFLAGGKVWNYWKDNAGAAANTGANNINNSIKLNHQLAAEEIAGGHGFQKHVLSQGEFFRSGHQDKEAVPSPY